MVNRPHSFVLQINDVGFALLNVEYDYFSVTHLSEETNGLVILALI